MSITKKIKIPGPDHPLSIAPLVGRIVVKAGGRVVADSTTALALQEAGYAVVHYLPIGDVNLELLERTAHSSYCPYKGDCVYFSIPGGGAVSVNAVWTYEQPYDAVASIKNHLAFYPDRVDSIEIIEEIKS